MNKCSNCGGPLLDLFTGKACGWECDLPTHKQSPAALGRTKAAMEKVAAYQAQMSQFQKAMMVPRFTVPVQNGIGSIQPHPQQPPPVPVAPFQGNDRVKVKGGMMNLHGTVQVVDHAKQTIVVLWDRYTSTLLPKPWKDFELVP